MRSGQLASNSVLGFLSGVHLASRYPHPMVGPMATSPAQSIDNSSDSRNHFVQERIHIVYIFIAIACFPCFFFYFSKWLMDKIHIEFPAILSSHSTSTIFENGSRPDTMSAGLIYNFVCLHLYSECHSRMCSIEFESSTLGPAFHQHVPCKWFRGWLAAAAVSAFSRAR